MCASFGAHLALVRVSCLDVPYQHLYPHHSHVNADELYPVAGTHWSEDALAHLATLSQCVRRTSFLSWIRSIHPLLAFECVAVLPPSVMAFCLLLYYLLFLNLLRTMVSGTCLVLGGSFTFWLWPLNWIKHVNLRPLALCSAQCARQAPNGLGLHFEFETFSTFSMCRCLSPGADWRSGLGLLCTSP